VQLGIRGHLESVKIFFCGNKLLVIFGTLLFEAKNFDLSVISDEKVFLADTNVRLRVVSEDVLDLCGRYHVFLDLHDVELLRIDISFIELEHKVVIEDVPTCNIIY
jgi:hypothetical protein